VSRQIAFLDEHAVTSRTPWPALIDAIGDAFREGGASPARHHHEIPDRYGDEVTLLLMPAWNRTGDFGVKLAALARANAGRRLPTLHGVYVLFEGATGVPQAVLDAGALTARRTAAASALASRYLSRPDARTLLVIGTGRVARNLIEAHCAVRAIEHVRVWGRNADHARAVAEAAQRAVDVPCTAVADVRRGATGADIISSAVPTEQPVLAGAWVEPGTHVDLVGAFRPQMCEADTALIAAADQVHIDTVAGAREEAGDLLQAVDAGVFRLEQVAGDLFAMAAREAPLPRGRDEITVFKSVGSALQDLAAAQLCLQT
jgi:alanine dehydrogenase